MSFFFYKKQRHIFNLIIYHNYFFYSIIYHNSKLR